MKKDKNLLSKIKEKMQKLTEEEFFSSSQYHRFLLSQVRGLMAINRLKRDIDIVVKYDPMSNDVAYTDNTKIVINAAHSFFGNGIEQKVENINGVLAHEIAHILFTNFDILQKEQQMIQGKSRFFKEPLPTPEREKFYKMLKNRDFRLTFLKIWKELDNLLEDAFIESAFLATQNGYLHFGLEKFRIYSKKEIKKYLLEEPQTMAKDGKLTFALFFNTLLLAFKYGADPQEYKNCPCYPLLLKHQQCADLDRQLKVEMDSSKRGSIKNSIMVFFLDEIMEIISSNEISPEFIFSFEKLNLDGENLIDKPLLSIGDAGMEDEDMNSFINSLKKEISADLAGDEDSCRRVDPNTLPPITNDPDIKIPSVHVKKSGKTFSIISAYQREYERIKKYSKTLSRIISERVKERKNGFAQRGLSFGKRVAMSDLHRQDGKIFSKKTLPSNTLDLAMAILVDQSGSMFGEKIEISRITAILMEDFARNLGVPIAVYGHNTSLNKNSEEEVIVYEYVKYGGLPNDKYLLSEIKSSGANHDGAAIRYVLSELNKRTESKKVLIVISDGMPMAVNYSGDSAIKDLQNVIKQYKGIQIIGAAIDEDFEQIKKIYGENFLGIRNLEKMPKSFAKILMKNI